MRALSLFVAVSLGVLQTSLKAETTAAASFADAAQPQLAANADGRVWIAFGRGKEIFVAASRDGGTTFEPAVRVAALPSLMLGRRRGPRIVAYGDRLTVTAMAGELFAFHSKDGGKTWMGPALVNDVRRCAREGLNGLAVAPDGRLFATWLDLRGERTQLFGAESTDGGATWSTNQLVYRAPAGNTVCECCHPFATYNERGDLAVMWRNAIGGNRDMWFAVRPAGTETFGPAAKLGEGSWQLKACPMDGGMVFADKNDFGTIWQRNGAVFLARPGEAERQLASGTQPVAAATPNRAVAVWQQGPDLWLAALKKNATPILFSRNGRFPAMLALPKSDRVIVAFERGSDVIVASADETISAQ